MKETKKSASGTFSSSAAARGKFGKICLILLLLVTAVFCGFAPQAQAQALEPNAEGVYELRTAQDLKDFRDLVNGGEVGANAKLMSDIDLGGEPWTPIGTGPYPDAYEGTFDGGGFTVSGVKVNINNGVDNGFGVCAGFFGFTYGNVKNLNVSGEISAKSSGDIYIGGIAGSVQFDGWGVPEGANITNCSFFGSVSADSTEGHVCVGGVVGQTVGANIAGCVYTGGGVTAVCGGQYSNNSVGGIIGQADSGTLVDNCTASSEKISASGTGKSPINMAGGIAGRLNYARMTNCTAASLSIKAEGGEDNDAGGITGNAHHGQMSGCAYTGGAGSITAAGGEYNNTGGISGNLEIGSSVSDCAWNEDASENATGMGPYLVDKETTKALPAEEFESGEIILSVIPACPVVNLTPGGSSTLSFTAYPGGKPLTQEQAAKYIPVPETAYNTFSLDTSVWPYVVTGTDAVGTEELVFSFYATNIVTGEPADAPTGNVTITVANAKTPAVVVHVESVSLDKTELQLAVGENATLSAAITPENATDKNVTWSSDNETVATVDANGVVTAAAPGSATITVTTADGGKTATCAVTVSAQPQPAPSGGSGGGGCSAGLGALALLAIVPLFARRKK